ncbi:hypothetical protein [Pengzhenrongella phosphoraccumulans]|uniref:hypothetical protein n=1 Tax=Pengzhenrongella phosphoraccumulans TaxID=3114394 RepID=UPI00389009E3
MAGTRVVTVDSATFPFDGHGVTHLLDVLVSDLNAGDTAAVAQLVAGERATRDGPPSGVDLEAAEAWIGQFGGLGLDDARYQWRRDLDGLRAEVQIAARTAAGSPTTMFLTVTGDPIVDGDLRVASAASSISGPEVDTRIGAAALTQVPASDGREVVGRDWAPLAGWAGVAFLIAGLVLSIGGSVRTSLSGQSGGNSVLPPHVN